MGDIGTHNFDKRTYFGFILLHVTSEISITLLFYYSSDLYHRNSHLQPLECPAGL